LKACLENRRGAARGFTTLAFAALAQLRVGTQAGRARCCTVVLGRGSGLRVMIKGPVTPLVAALTLSQLAVGSGSAKRGMDEAAHIGGRGHCSHCARDHALPWLIAIGIRSPNGRFYADLFAQRDRAQDLVERWRAPATAALLAITLSGCRCLIFPATYALPAAARLGFERRSRAAQR
jgi:hypothetical protein